MEKVSTEIRLALERFSSIGRSRSRRKALNHAVADACIKFRQRVHIAYFLTTLKYQRQCAIKDATTATLVELIFTGFRRCQPDWQPCNLEEFELSTFVLPCLGRDKNACVFLEDLFNAVHGSPER